MKEQEAIEFIKNKIQIDVKFCTDEDIENTKTALNIAINALEKQMPKHYELWNNQCSCPTCKKLFGSYDQLKNLIHWEMPYCKFCGQALIWKDHPTEEGGEG